MLRVRNLRPECTIDREQPVPEDNSERFGNKPMVRPDRVIEGRSQILPHSARYYNIVSILSETIYERWAVRFLEMYRSY